MGGGTAARELSRDWGAAVRAEKAYAGACIKHNGLAEECITFSRSVAIIGLVNQSLTKGIRVMFSAQCPQWFKFVVQSTWRDVRTPLLALLRSRHELSLHQSGANNSLTDTKSKTDLKLRDMKTKSLHKITSSEKTTSPKVLQSVFFFFLSLLYICIVDNPAHPLMYSVARLLERRSSRRWRLWWLRGVHRPSRARTTRTPRPPPPARTAKPPLAITLTTLITLHLIPRPPPKRLAWPLQQMTLRSHRARKARKRLLGSLSPS